MEVGEGGSSQEGGRCKLGEQQSLNSCSVNGGGLRGGKHNGSLVNQTTHNGGNFSWISPDMESRQVLVEERQFSAPSTPMEEEAVILRSSAPLSMPVESILVKEGGASETLSEGVIDTDQVMPEEGALVVGESSTQSEDVSSSAAQEGVVEERSPKDIPPVSSDKTTTTATEPSEGSLADSTLAVDKTDTAEPTLGSEGSLSNSTSAVEGTDQTLGSKVSLTNSTPTVGETNTTELTLGSDEGSLTNSTPALAEAITTAPTLVSNEPSTNSKPTVGETTTTELTVGSDEGSLTNSTPTVDEKTAENLPAECDIATADDKGIAKLISDEERRSNSNDSLQSSNGAPNVHEGEACSMEVTSNVDGGEGSPTSTEKASSMDTTPDEDGDSGIARTSGDGEECSRSATPTAGEVLTDSMVNEEKRLKEGGSREGSEEGDQRGELKGLMEQQRFLRLQHLLKQSNIYSKFLLQRMEEQRQRQEEKDKQRREKAMRRKSVKKKKGRSPQISPGSGRVTRLSLKSPPTPSQAPPTAKGKGGAKKGRKRKAKGEDDFQVSNFMDGQGKLKQMKLSSGKAAVTEGPEKNTLSLSTNEFDLEERYFDGKLIPYNQPRLVSGGIMRSYQLEGMEWIKSLYENGVNGILGDEMGLGKTLQCISFIAYLIEQGVKGPFLVAAPLSTVPNWVAEFKRFTPTIPVVLYHGTAAEREDLRRAMFSNTRLGRPRSKKKASSPDKDEPLAPVVVTSYEICMRDQRFLEHRSWKFLVVDEGHRIKNLNCKLIRALKEYDASNRLLLTGTPLQNNLSELWSLLNFLLPSIFNDLNSFQSWFDFDVAGEDEVRERIIAQEREQHVLSTLHQILTPFLLRRLKTDVEFSLPPKKEILVYAPLTSFQERYYKSLLDNTIYQMLEDTEKAKKGLPQDSAKEEGGLGKRERKRVSKYSSLNDDDFEAVLSGEKKLEDLCPSPQVKEKAKKVKHSVLDIKMTSVFTMLRKCCNHPYLLEFPLTESGEFKVDEEIVSCCGKVMLLDRMLPALIEQGHKTLIFSQFTSMLDILEDYLELRGLVFSRLDGSMAFPERERQMTMFRESPDCMVFLLSTRAGGLGINLTSADTVIIYDSDWNPQADLQAQDRCHRIGQSHPVMVYRLVTANTIDQRIVERAATKRRLEKMVIHKGKFKGVSSDYELSIDDLVDLLHSVDHEKIVDSENAVISDGALAALLDRTLQGDKATEEDAEGSLKGAGSIAHSGVFKIIAERDSSGKLVGEHSTDDIVCAGGPSTGGSVDTTESGDAGSAEIVTGAGGGDLDTKSGAGTPDMVGLDSGCGVGGVVGAAETASGKDLNIGCPAAMSATEDLPSESATPEPSSSGSLKSSSSLSIGSSSGSDGVQSMDTDAGTPASSLVLTGSSSPTPEPAAGGVVVADTEVKVCTGEIKMEDDRTVSSAAAGSLMTS